MLPPPRTLLHLVFFAVNITLLVTGEEILKTPENSSCSSHDDTGTCRGSLTQENTIVDQGSKGELTDGFEDGQYTDVDEENDYDEVDEDDEEFEDDEEYEDDEENDYDEEDEDDEENDYDEEDEGDKDDEAYEYDYFTREIPDPCKNYEDEEEQCSFWAEEDECNANPEYMLLSCHKSCCYETGVAMGVAQEIADKHHEAIMQNIVESYKYVRDVVLKTPDYRNTHYLCQNKDERCALWASHGECDANPNYMESDCAFSCQTCEEVDFSFRCPLDDPTVGDDAFQPGEMHKMFENIINNEEFAHFKPKVHSRPSSSAPSTKGDEDNDNKNSKNNNTNSEPKDGPWIVTFDSFLTAEEADTLIQLGADEGYERSEDAGDLLEDGTLDSVESTYRTSTNSWCWKGCYNHTVTRRVMDRIVSVVGVPERNFERLQMLRYQPGQFYGEHHDFIGHHVQNQCGPRILTFFLYLNDVEAGGATAFVDMNITVVPKKGKAVLWPSVLDSDLNKREDYTHHAALPVWKGEKYGANSWIHLRHFEGPNSNECVS